MQRQTQAGTGALEGKGSRVHMCIQCDFPVAVYGRIWPCLHAFCLCCASDMAKCSLCVLATGSAPDSVPSSIGMSSMGLDASLCRPLRRCSNAVGRIERVSREQGLFISPATLQSYRSAPGRSPHQRPTHTCPAPCPGEHARAPCAELSDPQACRLRPGRAVHSHLTSWGPCSGGGPAAGRQGAAGAARLCARPRAARAADAVLAAAQWQDPGAAGKVCRRGWPVRPALRAGHWPHYCAARAPLRQWTAAGRQRSTEPAACAPRLCITCTPC